MFVLFVTPFFKSDAPHFIEALADIPAVRLGVISQSPIDELDPAVRRKLAAHWKVTDILNRDQLAWAASELRQRMGQPYRLVAINEQIQLPIAELREKMGIEGMGPNVVKNFRDKALMKDCFRRAGVPCARHCGATSEKQAWDFIAEVGFPICVKPIDGAAAQSTYRVEDEEGLANVLRARAPSETHALQLEEFVTGTEHSFETLSVNGVVQWHSLTRYIPTPLDVMRNPWIQWRIVLPREIDAPEYDDVRAVGAQALQALGMDTGMGHMEWFRRADGSLAVSEIGCRPPGPQLVAITNRAHDTSIFKHWADLMVLGECTPPRERNFAAGAAFLRGLGGAWVSSTHGLTEVLAELGDMVTDYKLPEPGQPASVTYECEGWVLIRHPETARVEAALDHIVRSVRVEMLNCRTE